MITWSSVYSRISTRKGMARVATSPIAVFWLVIALILTAVLVAGHYGVYHIYLETFGDPQTLAVAGIVLAVFMYTLLWEGGKRAYFLYRGEVAMDILNAYTSSSKPLTRNNLVRAVRKLLNEAWVGCEDSAVASAIGVLADRVYVSLEVSTIEHANNAEFQDVFRDHLARGVGRFNQLTRLLLYVGLTGTAFGAVAMLALSGTVPTAPEALKLWNATIVHGFGVAYISSLWCFTGASFLQLLSTIFDQRAENLENVFNDRMFSLVFPVINSSAFRHPTVENAKSHDPTTSA